MKDETASWQRKVYAAVRDAFAKAKTTEPPEEWTEAFGEMIAMARRLKCRGETPEVAMEYGRAIGKIAANAGLTPDEGNHYGVQIWMSVREEPQA